MLQRATALLADVPPLPETCVTFVVPNDESNLIDHISEVIKRTRKGAEVLVETLLTSITDALAHGEKVDLRGFGSFHVKWEEGTPRSNPKTGETLTIAALNVMVLKPSKELAGSLNATTKSCIPLRSIQQRPAGLVTSFISKTAQAIARAIPAAHGRTCASECTADPTSQRTDRPNPR